MSAWSCPFCGYENPSNVPDCSGCEREGVRPARRRNSYQPELRDRAVELYRELRSYRAVGEVMGLSKQRVAKILEDRRDEVEIRRPGKPAKGETT